VSTKRRSLLPLAGKRRRFIDVGVANRAIPRVAAGTSRVRERDTQGGFHAGMGWTRL
jgi:hypothetical protein